MKQRRQEVKHDISGKFVTVCNARNTVIERFSSLTNTDYKMDLSNPTEHPELLME